MSDQWQPSLPGLTLPSQGDSYRGSVLLDAATRTLEALDSQGRLTEEHTLLCQLILELASSIGKELARGEIRVATSNAIKQLQEAIGSLPEPAEGDVGAEWAQVAAAVRGDLPAARGDAA